MRTVREIEELLERLDHCVADDLEDQDLDFKEWSGEGKRSFRTAVEWAICMANGGGGAVVFGVAEGVRGRARAIRGVPPEVDSNRLKWAVYDGTDPKLTPIVEEIQVPEGTGRIVVMFVYDGLPPYTDTAGRGLVRVGKDCKPLTGSLRGKLEARWGDGDYTAETVSGRPDELISPAAMESLRAAAALEQAPADLLALGDEELLMAAGVRRNGRLTRAALLLAGSETALREQVPGHLWTHLRMKGELEYSDRVEMTNAGGSQPVSRRGAAEVAPRQPQHLGDASHLLPLPDGGEGAADDRGSRRGVSNRVPRFAGVIGVSRLRGRRGDGARRGVRRGPIARAEPLALARGRGRHGRVGPALSALGRSDGGDPRAHGAGSRLSGTERGP